LSSWGRPKAVVGIVIAALVLLPEGLAALRAARANLLQTSLNLALGSALASIGLMIPAVAVVAIALGQPLELGLGGKDQVLLALTLLVNVITLGTGRTTVLQGIVHLVIFAAFLFLAVVPPKILPTACSRVYQRLSGPNVGNCEGFSDASRPNPWHRSRS
jgi:Ca2+:H+ antiporter